MRKYEPCNQKKRKLSHSLTNGIKGFKLCKQKHSKRQTHLLDNFLNLPYQIIDMIDEYLRFGNLVCYFDQELRVTCITTKFNHYPMKVFCSYGDNGYHGFTLYELYDSGNNCKEYDISGHIETKLIHKMLNLNNGEIVMGASPSLIIYNPVTKNYYSYSFGLLDKVIPLCEIIDDENQILAYAIVPRRSFRYPPSSMGWLILLHLKNPGTGTGHDHTVKHRSVYMGDSDQQFEIDTPDDSIKNTFVKLSGSKFVALSNKSLWDCCSLTDEKPSVNCMDWLDNNEKICNFVVCDQMLIYFHLFAGKLLIADLLIKKNLDPIIVPCHNHNVYIFEMIKISNKKISFIALDGIILNGSQIHYFLFTMDVMTHRIEKMYQTENPIHFVGCLDDGYNYLIIQEVDKPFRILIFDLLNQRICCTIETNESTKPFCKISENKLICASGNRDGQIAIFE